MQKNTFSYILYFLFVNYITERAILERKFQNRRVYFFQTSIAKVTATVLGGDGGNKSCKKS